jgi:hypothetical protein
MVITATIRFPHFKQSVVRSIGSSRFYRKLENRNVVPLVRYTNRRRSARKRSFILPKETKAGWPDYTSEAQPGPAPADLDFLIVNMRQHLAGVAHVEPIATPWAPHAPVGAPSRLSLGSDCDGTKQEHLPKSAI